MLIGEVDRFNVIYVQLFFPGPDIKDRDQFTEEDLAVAFNRVVSTFIVEVHRIGKGIDGETLRIEGDRIAFDAGGNRLGSNPVFFGDGLDFGLFCRLLFRFDKALGQFFGKMDHMEVFRRVFGVGQFDRYVDRRFRLNAVAFRVNDGDVVQAGQADVVGVQGGGGLLSVGFPQVASFGNLGDPDLGACRDLRFGAVADFDLVGIAVGSHDLLGDPGQLDHAADGGNVGGKGDGIDGFVVVTGGFGGIGVGFDDGGLVFGDLDRLDVLLFRQLDLVPEDDLDVNIRLGFDLLTVADIGNIEIALQRDFAPVLAQGFVGHATVNGIFRRTGHNLPDLQLGARRKAGLRAVGSGHHVVPGLMDQLDRADLNLMNRTVAEGLAVVNLQAKGSVIVLQ